MSDQNNNDHLVDQSETFFDQPVLLKSEDKTQSLKLLTAVAEYMRPENVFDWMMVNDTTNNYREEMRFRRISASLIESAKPKALEVLLRPFCGSGDIFFGDMFKANPSEIAKGYFCDDPKNKKAMALRVADCGITAELIEAKATELVIGPLLILDRMSGNREKSRRILRKEHELRRKEREQPLVISHDADHRPSPNAKSAAA